VRAWATAEMLAGYKGIILFCASEETTSEAIQVYWDSGPYSTS
jgi:hypothetical protein